MTSRSRRKRLTTPPSTSARRAAEAYRAVAAATAPRPEPLWLPSGWLAIVLLLTATAAAPAAEWRARGASKSEPHATSQQPLAKGRHAFVERGTSIRPPTASGWGVRQAQFQQAPVRAVDFEDDIAGPQLRIATRDDYERSVVRQRRVAQQPNGGALQDAFERPFGADGADQATTDALGEAMERPFGVDQRDRAVGEALEEALEQPFGVREPAPETDTEELPEPDTTRPEMTEEESSEGLFDDLPPDPFEEPAPEMEPDADDLPSPQEQGRPRDLFEAPTFDDPQDRDDEDEQDEEDAADRKKRDDALAKERAKAAEACADNLAKVKASRLTGIDLTIAVTGVEGEDYPFSCSIDDGLPAAPRCWEEVTYMWKASALCHKPLYFEDTQLERYGHSFGPYTQPLISGAHFFSRIFLLPYNIGLQAPNECVYTLGHYRPGDCAPYMIEPIPITKRAALFQAGAAVGVAGILP